MTRTPHQRKAGQTGGFGGMPSNRSRSLARGGTPTKGGGGSHKKPPGGCCVVALVFLAVAALPVLLHTWVLAA